MHTEGSCGFACSSVREGERALTCSVWLGFKGSYIVGLASPSATNLVATMTPSDRQNRKRDFEAQKKWKIDMQNDTHSPTKTFWDDARIKTAVASLVDKGFQERALKNLSTDQILSVIGRHFPVEAVNIVGCLRDCQHQKSIPDLFSKYHKFVGRVHVDSVDDGAKGDGSCVLIGDDGLTATCLHVVKFDGKKISVCYPFGCTRVRRNGTVYSTPIEFSAEVVFADEANDVALLLPSAPKRFKDLDYFYWWSAGAPRHTDAILLISHPDLLREENHLNKGSRAGDMPTSYAGSTSHVNPSRLVVSYTSLAGCLGGLVLNVAECDGRHGIGIHSGVMSDCKPLKQWDDNELALLNDNLEKKAYLGVATRDMSSILHAFQTRTKVAKQIGQKVAATVKATKEGEGSLPARKRKAEPATADETSAFGRRPGCRRANKREVELPAIEDLPLFAPWPGDDGYVTEQESTHDFV